MRKKTSDYQPHRILIDVGCTGHAGTIASFLIDRNYREFGAVICTHAHNDQASGLIKLVEDQRFIFHDGWMHNIANHVNADVLRRAAASDEGVRKVVETTARLAAAFSNRNIPVREPFTTDCIAGWPEMFVLGPSKDFYRKQIAEFAKVNLPSLNSAFLMAGIQQPTKNEYPYLSLARLGSAGSSLPNYLSVISPPLKTFPIPIPPLTGVLSNSSLKENPKTQPYNNTSVILGVRYLEHKHLLTADAGSEALAHVSSDWNHLEMCTVPHHASDGNSSQNDLERFCPKFALISAKGDLSHPSRSVVSALVKVGAKVASTHSSGNLWYHIGNVPTRCDYGPVEYLTGTGSPEPVSRWLYPLVNAK